jgi:hypothetical protein
MMAGGTAPLMMSPVVKTSGSTTFALGPGTPSGDQFAATFHEPPLEGVPFPSHTCAATGLIATTTEKTRSKIICGTARAERRKANAKRPQAS